MNRHKLELVIGDIAAELGYSFCVGSFADVLSKVKAYPLLWLQPLSIKRISGRDDCTVIYKVDIVLMASSRIAAHVDAGEVRQVLEANAVSLRKAMMSHKEIRNVVDFRMSSGKQPITKNAEATMSIECEVMMYVNRKEKV